MKMIKMSNKCEKFYDSTKILGKTNISGKIVFLLGFIKCEI